MNISETKLTAKGLARRETILNTACQLFAQKGVDSVSTKELAAAADCSEALLFRYFPTKNAIFETLLEEYCDIQKAPVLIPVQPGESGRDWLRRVMRELQHYKDAAGRPGLRDAISSRISARQAADEAVQASSDIVQDLIIPIFSYGKQDGSLPVQDCERAAVLFWLIQIGITEVRNHYTDRNYPLPSFEDTLRAVLTL